MHGVGRLGTFKVDALVSGLPDGWNVPEQRDLP